MAVGPFDYGLLPDRGTLVRPWAPLAMAGSLAWAYALWLWAPCLGILPLLKAKSRVLLFFFIFYSILIFIYREDKNEYKK